MRGSWNRFGWIIAVGTVFSFLAVLHAAPSPAQREQINEINLAITKAGNLYKQGKHKESADAIKEAHGKLEKLSASPNSKELKPMLDPIFDKMERAYGALELEGYVLPPIKRLTDAPATPAPGAAAAGAVTFSKDVAPILISRCGNCHVRNARGNISMASYAALIKGKTGLEMVVPNNPDASFLIGVIEDAKMPPSGNKIPANEIAILKKWIADGGKFDGKNPEENLGQIAPNAKAATAPKVELATATGKEKISFSRDIAPMFESSCAGCHGNGRRPEGNFNLVTFDALLRGGDTGPAFVPGKPAESYLIKKLKGTGTGPRMPARAKPWTDEMIAKVELWIQEGGKFDGISPRANIERVIAVYKAQHSTHEELSLSRVALAQKNWDLSSPGIKAARFESENFLVLGDLGDNTLKDIGERAEALTPKIAKFLQAPADKPLVKGRFTLFVFKERYGYSQLGEMVEKRSLPTDWRGHWDYDIVDAYGAVVPPRGTEYSLEGIVAQNITGGYIASSGKNVPRWFSEGMARYVASKVAPTDTRVATWNDQLGSAVSTMSKPDDFINGKLSPEYNDIVSYGFVTALSTNNSGRGLQRLMEEIRNGTDFEKAFSTSFGGTVQQAAEAFAKRPPQIKSKGPTRPTGKKNT